MNHSAETGKLSTDRRRFRGTCLLLGIPGIAWGAILIRTGYNIAQGWWLIGATSATFVVMGVYVAWPRTRNYHRVLVIIGLIMLVSGCALPRTDVVVFMQPIVIVGCVVAEDRARSAFTRLGARLIATIVAGILVVMLFGAWGMS